MIRSRILMKRLSITQLVPGMTVAEDVYDLDHELLVQKGTVLTDKLITKLDLDLNSRFELKPGEKDPERIRTFLNELKS